MLLSVTYHLSSILEKRLSLIMNKKKFLYWVNIRKLDGVFGTIYLSIYTLG